MTKFLLLFLLPAISIAQIPNGSFENWTNNHPDNGWTSNIEGVLEPITRSSDAFNGDYAIKGEVLPTSLYVPILWTGDIESSYIDIDQKYTTLRGYYKFFTQDTNEILFGTVAVTNAEITSTFGLGTLYIKGNAESYTLFEVDIEYYTEETPKKMSIYLTITSDSLPLPGTYFILDNLSLSTVTGLEKDLVPNPESYFLQQNYPNPFNPTTKITYKLPKSGHTTLKVYDNNGREIQTLIDKYHSAGSYTINFDGAALPSGIYYYRLTSGSYSETKRMLFVK